VNCDSTGTTGRYVMSLPKLKNTHIFITLGCNNGLRDRGIAYGYYRRGIDAVVAARKFVSSITYNQKTAKEINYSDTHNEFLGTFFGIAAEHADWTIKDILWEAIDKFKSNLWWGDRLINHDANGTEYGGFDTMRIIGIPYINFLPLEGDHQ